MIRKYDLSICIPSRNEMFLSKTIEDILSNSSERTEVIALLDGQWSEPAVADHPRLTLIYYPESIGQRAATNQCVKLSRAKYVMKTDAHCAFDKDFDVKLMADMQDNWTMVPIMRNLHAFDWVCPDGHRRYQGPSGACQQCGKETTRDVVWIPKQSPQSKSYCFDSEPHFQYFGDWNKRPEGKGDLTETMSLQGSCFMCTRDKYWELKLSDEEFGSWGSQGIEVAAKTWLSGGRVVVNQKTWYAHMFRTQGGDFGFPYAQSGRSVQNAKKHAKSLFFENKWPQQIHPLSWLVEKFWPVKGWTDADLANIKKFDHVINAPKVVNVAPVAESGPTKGIIFYTDNKLTLKIAHSVQKQLRNIGLPIFSASLKPMVNMGTNTYLPLERGIPTYFKQIVAALNSCNTDIVFFCEHDVLYNKTHFDFTPPSKTKFYYNTNVLRWKFPEDWFVTWEAEQVAELCCYRDLALEWYSNKLKEVEAGNFNRSYEPGSRNQELFEDWRSERPNIDIRHGANLTKSKWSIRDFRDKSTCVNWQEGTMSAFPGVDREQLLWLMK